MGHRGRGRVVTGGVAACRAGLRDAVQPCGALGGRAVRGGARGGGAGSRRARGGAQDGRVGLSLCEAGTASSCLGSDPGRRRRGEGGDAGWSRVGGPEGSGGRAEGPRAGPRRGVPRPRRPLTPRPPPAPRWRRRRAPAAYWTTSAACSTTWPTSWTPCWSDAAAHVRTARAARVPARTLTFTSGWAPLGAARAVRAASRRGPGGRGRAHAARPWHKHNACAWARPGLARGPKGSG